MNPTQIDPRGQQFNAALTSVVLIVVLVAAPGPVGIAALSAQAGLFGVAVLLGVQRTPAAWLYKRFVRPRLGPPAHLEDSRPPRFAQGLGLVFTLVALVGYLGGVPALGVTATVFALLAATLNATLRICLGCKLYGLCTIKSPTHQRSTNKKEVTA